ncbi:DUF1705 domain-containing protein, partial [Pseudomonas syringae]
MPTPRALRPEVVTLFASGFLLLGFNINMWQHLFAITSVDAKGVAMRFAFGLMVFCVFNIFLTLLAFQRVFKPVMIFLFMVSAGVVYFMTEYGVMIDAG